MEEHEAGSDGNGIQTKTGGRQTRTWPPPTNRPPARREKFICQQLKGQAAISVRCLRQRRTLQTKQTKTRRPNKWPQMCRPRRREESSCEKFHFNCRFHPLARLEPPSLRWICERKGRPGGANCRRPRGCRSERRFISHQLGRLLCWPQQLPAPLFPFTNGGGGGGGGGGDHTWRADGNLVAAAQGSSVHLNWI